MIQRVKVTFGNVSSGVDKVRICESKNEAFMWINHEMVRAACLNSCHEIFVRIESYSSDVFNKENDYVLPF